MIKTKADRLNFSRNTERVPEHLARDWTQRLLGGETGPKADGIARYLIHDFYIRAGLNEPQSVHTLSCLAEVLSKILEEGKPDARKAFSLLPRREGAGAHVDAAIDIACWTAMTIKRGYSEADAVRQAAAIFHRDAKHIQRQRKRASDWPEGMSPKADWDEYFRLIGRPLPSPVSGSKRKQARTRTR